MKAIQKIVCGVMAFIMCCTVSEKRIEASETTFLKGDIDGNGVVNMIDYTNMIKFLSGQCAANGRVAERLDLNKDGVITYYDKSLLASIILEDVPQTTIRSSNTDNLPSQSNRSYYKFDMSSTSYSVYTLSPVANITDASTYTIIDSDDRVQENGLNGVIKVSSSMGLGTAFVVGPHTILTAAHVLSDKDTRQVAYDADFQFYTNYNTVSNFSVTPTAYHVPSAFFGGSNAWIYDYAVVTVEEDLSDYVNFDLGVMRDCMSRTKPVYVTGFGGNGGGDPSIDPSLIGTKSTGVGTLSPVDVTYVGNWRYAIYYNTDIVAGDSGAPVYVTNTDGTKTVIGINNYSGSTYNQGTRITTDILHFVYNNNNLN